jgi:uncharacterized membrane protein YhaH (DUF805 family)
MPGFQIAKSGARAMFYVSSLLRPFTTRAGRVSQSSYILGFVLPFIVLLGLTGLMFAGALGVLGPPGMYVVALGWTVLMATGDAQNIRRWNDLGSSGVLYRVLRPGLVLLPVLALVLQFVLPAHMAMAGDMAALSFMIGMEFGGVAWQPVPLALLAITLVGAAGNVLYLAITPGQQGPNAYGPDPHGDPMPALGGPKPGETAGAEDDPVKRALADYQARQREAVKSQVAPARAAGTPAAPAGAFGKKRR